MSDATGRPLPKTAWALTAIERLFDLVRDEISLARTEYDIVGISGGAQFVLQLHKEGPASLGVCAFSQRRSMRRPIRE